MKRTIIIALFFLLTLASCQKSGLRLFRGDYSFKTSGNVTMKKLLSENDSIPVSFTVKLANEIGQLQISDLGNEKDSVLVVINTMGGDVVVTHAFCDGNEIFLKDFTKRNLVFTGDSIMLKNGVRVWASGEIYESNTIILNMVYDGKAEIFGLGFGIHGDNIRMVATRN